MQKPPRTFTLIELLMVMAVIAVLAGLIMAAINFVTTSANKAKTRSQISALYIAIKSYESNYGTLPLIPTNGLINPGNGSSGDNNAQYQALIRCLLPKDSDNPDGNTRGITFLVPNSGPATTPGFVDMWKHDLKVVMTSSGKIAANGIINDTIYSNVAIWSMGPNGRDDKGSTTTPGDDITSWK